MRHYDGFVRVAGEAFDADQLEWRCEKCGKNEYSCDCEEEDLAMSGEQTLLDLAARVEAAEPDIGASLALVALEDEVKVAMWEQGIPPQPFLHSLDAATMLVPERTQFMLTTDGPRYLAHVSGFTASAATPALALTAAALRAIAHQMRIKSND